MAHLYILVDQGYSYYFISSSMRLIILAYFLLVVRFMYTAIL